MVFSAFKSTRSDTRNHARPRQQSLFSFHSQPTDPTLQNPIPPAKDRPSLLSGRSTSHSPSKSHPDLKKLNNCLVALAEVFPNVRPEVFREMLSVFGEESRLEVVSHQLLTHNARWVKGRWRINSKGTSSTILKEIFEAEETAEDKEGDNELVPLQETFRSENYKQGSRAALRAEFGRLVGKSAIEGVLAEQNYSYSLSRPILLGISQRSWRNTLSSFMRWGRSSRPAENKHFMVLWAKTSPGSPINVPTLRPTGCPELDEELHATLLRPLLDTRLRVQEKISSELATLLNEQEAEAVGATFECECCFSDVTFEAMAVCTTGSHVVCFRCIQHAVSEALYGQSWGMSINHERSQVACLAPSSTPCAGCIPHDLTRRAVLQSRGGDRSWAKLESRLAEDAMQMSGVKLARCPFCTYAEIDDIYVPPHAVKYSLSLSDPMQTLLLLCLTSFFVPMIAIYHFSSFILSLPPLQAILHDALKKLTRKTHLSPRFTCRNLSCARRSCRLCRAVWRDPHTCHESAALSLRTTVEAARTAALKRTCPKCGLAFVKESGCNKMVCVCGYSMCYICRQGLGKKPVPARDDGRRHPAERNAPDLGGVGGGGNVLGFGLRGILGDMANGANDDQEGEGEGQGYRHFCQHFRPSGGRCAECNRCDLYRSEDEDEIVRRAGERAEKEWRSRQGKKAEAVGTGGSTVRRDEGMEEKAGLEGRVQALVDWWVGRVVRC